MRCGHLKRDRVRRLAAVGAMLPTVVLLTTVRPVRAAAPELEVGRFGATFEAAAISTEGDVGAGGGLVTFDTAAPKVTGRLDSGPSAAATAAVVEPGTLARTGAGQVNGGAGEKVIDLPLATASWPGSGNATYKLAERLEVGPLIFEPGEASATATATSAAAVARVDGLALSVSDSAATDLSSLVRIGDSVAEGAATAADNANILTVTGTSRVGRARRGCQRGPHGPHGERHARRRGIAHHRTRHCRWHFRGADRRRCPRRGRGPPDQCCWRCHTAGDRRARGGWHLGGDHPRYSSRGRSLGFR